MVILNSLIQENSNSIGQESEGNPRVNPSPLTSPLSKNKSSIQPKTTYHCKQQTTDSITLGLIRNPMLYPFELRAPFTINSL